MNKEQILGRSLPSEQIQTAKKTNDEEQRLVLEEKVKKNLHDLKNILAQEFSNQKEKIEEIKKVLIKVMRSLHELSLMLDPLQKENREIYGVFIKSYFELVRLKENSEKDISQAFSEIFYEFSDFIDDEYVGIYIARMKSLGQAVSWEHATQALYGRTKEEVEQIKEMNRQKAIKEILKMKDESNITLEMIEKLHLINNKSIVPKSLSKLRSQPGSVMWFGKRVGALGEQVEEEMEGLVERANELVEQKEEGGLSMSMYEIAVAKLYNQLVLIHPFKDRNHSTAMLLMELLMAKQGYEPPLELEKDHYIRIKKVLDNFVAVSLIAFEHYYIFNEYGYYKGEETSEEIEEMYQENLERLKKARGDEQEEPKRQLKKSA